MGIVEVLDESKLLLLCQDCHTHLRNIWTGAVNKKLSKYLANILAVDLANVNIPYCVTTSMEALLLAVNKEFSLPANYHKDHGNQYKYWLKMYHPVVLLIAVCMDLYKT